MFPTPCIEKTAVNLEHARPGLARVSNFAVPADVKPAKERRPEFIEGVIPVFFRGVVEVAPERAANVDLQHIDASRAVLTQRRFLILLTYLSATRALPLRRRLVRRSAASVLAYGLIALGSGIRQIAVRIEGFSEKVHGVVLRSGYQPALVFCSCARLALKAAFSTLTAVPWPTMT